AVPPAQVQRRGLRPQVRTVGRVARHRCGPRRLPDPRLGSRTGRCDRLRFPYRARRAGERLGPAFPPRGVVPMAWRWRALRRPWRGDIAAVSRTRGTAARGRPATRSGISVYRLTGGAPGFPLPPEREATRYLIRAWPAIQ